MTELLRVRSRASHLSADPSDLAAWLHERWRRGELPHEAGELVERLAQGELRPERIRLAAWEG